MSVEGLSDEIVLRQNANADKNRPQLSVRYRSDGSGRY